MAYKIVMDRGADPDNPTEPHVIGTSTYPHTVLPVGFQLNVRNETLYKEAAKYVGLLPLPPPSPGDPQPQLTIQDLKERFQIQEVTNAQKEEVTTEFWGAQKAADDAALQLRLQQANALRKMLVVFESGSPRLMTDIEFRRLVVAIQYGLDKLEEAEP